MSTRATRQTRSARGAADEPPKATRSGARIQPARTTRKRDPLFEFTDDSDAPSDDLLSQETATSDEDMRDELAAAALLTPVAPERYFQARPAGPSRQIRDQDVSAALRNSSVLRQARLSAPQAAIRPRDSPALSNLREGRNLGMGPRKSAPQVIITSRHAKSEYDSDATNDRTISRPPPRFRPSLSGPDGRLDVPTVQERCAVLTTVAKGVLHFYMDLVNGWRPETFDDMVRNWLPFEAYKTNQVLAQDTYFQHFIDFDEVVRSLRLTGDRGFDGLEDALKMANCATFVHYIHQFHLDPAQYNKRDGRSITFKDVFNADMRSITELSDARRVFLSWIVPFHWSITDEVLNMLLDMSIQIFIYRLQVIVDSVRSGQRDENSALDIINEELAEVVNGEIVRKSLSRVKSQRGASRGDIERHAQRYETFCNVRQTELLNYSMLDDLDAIRRNFKFMQMARDLTSYVGDVVRDVDAGMHSKTLSDVMSRLQRASSVVTSSEASFPTEDYSSVPDRSVRGRGPIESTPRATYAESAGLSQPFASQYENWLEEMLSDTQTQRQDSSPPNSLRPALQQRVNLTSTQLLAELDFLARGETDDEAELFEDTIIDRRRSRPQGRGSSRLPSSPPRSKTLSDRLSAAKPPSGRSLRPPPQQSVLSASEQSEESSALHAGNVPDSPTGAKATRMNFDSQLRLVRKPTLSTTANRMLDGRTDAVRESRFDSQAEGEEDIFLERPPPKQPRSKGKGKETAKKSRAAREPSEVLTDDNAGRRPGRVTRSMSAEPAAASAAVQKRSGKAKERAASPPLQPIEEFFQLDTEDYMPEPEQDSPPRKRQLEENVAVETAPRNKKAKDVPRTGIGRGLPEGQEARDLRLLSTASGRLMETRDDADDAVPDPRVRQTRPSMAVAPAELRRSRASPDDDDFIEDDDEDVRERRAGRAEKQKALEKMRQQRLAAETDAALLDTIGEGPSAPRIVERRGYREEVLPKATADNDSFVDELEAPASSEDQPRVATPPLTQTARVGSYRNTDIYVTGHNQNGRNFWTDAEVKCLMDALHDLAKIKDTRKSYQVYTAILTRHGKNGDKKLVRWNNVQLKDKARNELIRMRRDHHVIPYWKRILFPSLFDTPRFQRYTEADIAAEDAAHVENFAARVAKERNAGHEESEDELQTEADLTSQPGAADTNNPASSIAGTPAPSKKMRSSPLHHSP